VEVIVRRSLAAVLLLVALALCPLAAPAQTIDETTYTEWTSMVERVDRVLDADRANEETLNRLRAEVAKFRDQFLAAENANADKVQRAQRQLDTLGPAPAEGQTEPEEVASRRNALNQEIASLKAPAVRATEAFVQADAMVSEIDKALRARQASKVLQRYPVPFNPLNWTATLAELRDAILRVPNEAIANLQNADHRANVVTQLPSALLLGLAGAIMVFRTRAWTDRVARRVHAIKRASLRRALTVLITFSQLTVPLVGLLLMLSAFKISGLLGDTGDSGLTAIGAIGVSAICSTWLVREVYPRKAPERTPLRILAEYVPEARRLSYFLAAIFALHIGFEALGKLEDFSNHTIAYSGYALGIFAAVVLYRIAYLFRISQRSSAEVEDDSAFSANVVAFVAGFTQVLCVVAVVAGTLGYVALAKQLIYPSVSTYFFFALLTLIQRGVSEFHSIVTTGDTMKSGKQGLFPTLFGSAMMLASLPILAMIWGTSSTTLWEFWARTREGFQVGDMRVSPNVFFIFLLIFLIGYGITRLVQGALRTTILPKTSLDPGTRNAMVSGVGYVGIFLAALSAITMAGIDLSSLAIFASALAVGIGFGLQTIVQNFVSGIILLVERPITEGDWIQVGNQQGYVRKISVRSTIVETFDRTHVIVPNADLVSGVVTNWTHGNSIGRVIVPVGVAYGTDTRKVEKVLLEIARAHPLVVVTPPPAAVFIGFGPSSMDFEIRAILRDVNYVLSVKSDMNHEIARRFAEEDIQIPFPQQDLWVRNAADLRHDPPAAQPEDYGRPRIADIDR